MSKWTGATSGAGTVYTTGASEITPVLEGFARCVLVCGPWFVSSSSIFGLWTIVCLFVFNRWFVDHSMSLRL